MGELKNKKKNSTIGVLALQGAFREHIRCLQSCGAQAREIRTTEQLAGVDGLIIPGGESTTIGKLTVEFGFIEPLLAFTQSGKPVWGTCAGMIFLAKDVGRDQPTLGVMDIVVKRNAFGRQIDSFNQCLACPQINQALGLEDTPSEAVFIRAPLIERVGPGVQVLVQLSEGMIVAARQKNLLATSFHPELTSDLRWHRYFLGMLGSGE